MNNKYIILFDGVCNFCNYWVNFILDRDFKKIFLFCPLQSKAGQNLLEKFQLPKNEFNTFVLIMDENYLIKSDAAIHIAVHLKGWASVFKFARFIPKSIRDFIYDFIAKHRYKIFGKQEYCRIPTDEEKSRFIL